ncbi:hypothetical protein EPUS_04671 [Endocarpon pusillum Z07020]|uniref:AMP-dependent synthetase/ligase domain-containing protein n=1 Tax=Endocarpon pusillum (strain Z07020 / HMAS-L-300199) TaxID=1263415 RepID=U1G9A4_ENDPU|nr:uncharacterized protein EPUS_04671 [Endocarpon pusillum Z07020]ERF68573.1 hypothetical protein EPUS_04671 [Endocarpon pusillum Z07020]
MAAISLYGRLEFSHSNLLTYIFDRPEDDDDFHSSNVPTIISAEDPNRLQMMGLKPGERIALVSGNTIYFPLVALGTIAAGGVFTSLLPEFKTRKIASYLQDTSARYILASKDFLDILLAAADQSNFPKASILVFDDSLKQMELQPPLHHWSTIFSTQLDPPFRWQSLESEAKAKSTTAVIMHTSGKLREMPKARRSPITRSLANWRKHFETSIQPQQFTRASFAITRWANPWD